MATNVILPALGMSQDTGKIVQWLKAEGDLVAKGDPLLEVETDKATVEIEAPADGILTHVTSAAGDDVPVGQVIAVILASNEIPTGHDVQTVEQPPAQQFTQPLPTTSNGKNPSAPVLPTQNGASQPPADAARQAAFNASPLASRIAAEHNLDLTRVKAAGRRIQKADVLAYLQEQEKTTSSPNAIRAMPRLTMASPKARRLALEMGKDLATLKGTGPGGAIIAADVLQAPAPAATAPVLAGVPTTRAADIKQHNIQESAVSTIWRIMAERTTRSWTSVPHFYLVREVNASRLITWHEQLLKRSTEKVTYTDLLVKIVAAALRQHPRLNASWHEGKIMHRQDIEIGLAVAVEEGLVVPVIHQADTLRLEEIARLRQELVAKAQAGKLRPQDIQNGTFTISNLGMYNVDAFHAIINQPQAAILAVGRIAERVVPVNGQPGIQPMLVLTLSCDHRTIDGARAAQFLATLAELIEEPLGLLA